jgi:hypothetical protein
MSYVQGWNDRRKAGCHKDKDKVTDISKAMFADIELAIFDDSDTLTSENVIVVYCGDRNHHNITEGTILSLADILAKATEHLQKEH